ncbi:MAG: hypothetical protein WCE61_10335 [Candidatus Acidiferrum sp.]
MSNYKPRQIVALLGQIEVENANGKTTPQARKKPQFTAHSYLRQYHELKMAKVKPSLGRS